MFKAVALICSVWIADGRAKQECFTHILGVSDKEGMSVKSYRAKENLHTIILY